MGKTFAYYSFNKVCSYNGTYNFVVGGRGLGKTYGIKVKAVKDYLKTGEQFIYLRRFRPELVNAKSTFFADFAHLFPKYIFRVQGMEAQMAKSGTDPKEKNAWQTIGYFASLASGQSMKSMSFPRVTKIIFDEFIIEKGAVQYLPNEHVVFNNFYSTVDRWQDKTEVYFLANSVSMMCPYFIAYDIQPDKADDGGILIKSISVNKDGRKSKKNFIVCHFPDSKLFAMQVFETEFGRFIKENDEEYSEYAVGNKFADNHQGLIGSKDSKARYLYTLETNKGSFSVWFDMFKREWTIQEKRPKQETMYTLIPEKMTEGKRLLTYSDKLIQKLRTAFRAGKVMFDKPATRNVFVEVFKR